MAGADGVRGGQLRPGSLQTGVRHGPESGIGAWPPPSPTPAGQAPPTISSHWMPGVLLAQNESTTPRSSASETWYSYEHIRRALSLVQAVWRSHWFRRALSQSRGKRDPQSPPHPRLAVSPPTLVSAADCCVWTLREVAADRVQS